MGANGRLRNVSVGALLALALGVLRCAEATTGDPSAAASPTAPEKAEEAERPIRPEPNDGGSMPSDGSDGAMPSDGSGGAMPSDGSGGPSDANGGEAMVPEPEDAAPIAEGPDGEEPPRPGPDAGELADADAGEPREYPAGEPGCGLEAAAFCDTFDEPAEKDLADGRSGELEAAWWSGARMEPSLNWGDEALAVGPATIGRCRDELPDQVFPNQDVLVCDGDDAIASRHLLVAAAAQNYGQTSLRIRRPFDFRDRVGKVVFDAEALPGGLLGWVSLAITEDPSPAPSFAIEGNWENGAIPRRGVEVHLNQNCQTENKVGVAQINVFDDWVERFYQPSESVCVTTSPGQLNHFEVRVSTSRFEIWASDVSVDGVSFGALQELYAVDIDLPFERGYVHLNTHNHATLKYSDGETMDAWVARYDNVGFDGPVISNFREYSVPDKLSPIDVGGVEELNLGYQIAPELPEADRTLTFANVDTSGAVAAHVALDTRYLMGQGTPYEEFVLRYRLNGGQWHDYALAPGQLDLLQGPYVYNELGENVRTVGEGIAGAMAQWLELDLAELVSGDNTIEFATEGIPTSYRPFVANVDLVLELE
jgi:hypothetical protein